MAQAQAGLTGAQASPTRPRPRRRRLPPAGRTRRALKPRVQRAQAALEQAKLNLEYTRVKAARGGLVSRRTVEPGQIVQAGQPLLAIVPLDDVWVTANFKETQLERDATGPGRAHRRGRLRPRIRRTPRQHRRRDRARFSLLPPENASGNFVKVVQRVPVKIVLNPGQDPEQRLRPGMSVHVYGQHSGNQR